MKSIRLAGNYIAEFDNPADPKQGRGQLQLILHDTQRLSKEIQLERQETSPFGQAQPWPWQARETFHGFNTPYLSWNESVQNVNRYKQTELELRPGTTAENTWEVIRQVVDSLENQGLAIEFNEETQNENSFVGSILSVVGIDIADIDTARYTPNDVTDYVGSTWNVFNYGATQLFGGAMPQLVKITAQGTDGTDYIQGGAAGDLLGGKAYGNDTIKGGAGDDTVQGSDQDNLLEGGLGNDRIIAGSGNDVVNGGSGRDTIEGGFGNDTIDGGSRSDILSGGNGRDVFVFNRGNGLDEIRDFDQGSDQIRLGSGLSFDNVQLLKVGDATQITFTSGAFAGDRIKLIGIDPDEVTYADFEGATSVTRPDPLQPTYVGTNGSDYFSDRNGKDNVVFMRGGQDIIYAGRGDDIIDAGPGDDWAIYGDWTSYSIRTSGGKDKFWLKTGNGIDQVRDFEDGLDKILLEDGKTFDDIEVSGWFNLTEVSYKGGAEGDRMLISGVDASQITADDFVTLADLDDTPTLPRPDPSPEPTYQLRFGTNGDDRINTGVLNQKIFARDGDDNIFAGAGDDWINAGAGNDWEIYGDATSLNNPGGGGRDIFYFATGNEIDMVRDFENGIDKIELANNRDFDDVTVSGWGNNTTIRFKDGNDGDMLLLMGVSSSLIDWNDFI